MHDTALKFVLTTSTEPVRGTYVDNLKSIHDTKPSQNHLDKSRQVMAHMQTDLSLFTIQKKQVRTAFPTTQVRST